MAVIQLKHPLRRALVGQPGCFVLRGHLRQTEALTIGFTKFAPSEVLIVFRIKGVRSPSDFDKSDDTYTASFDKFVKTGGSRFILYPGRKGPGLRAI